MRRIVSLIGAIVGTAAIFWGLARQHNAVEVVATPSTVVTYTTHAPTASPQKQPIVPTPRPKKPAASTPVAPSVPTPVAPSVPSVQQDAAAAAEPDLALKASTESAIRDITDMDQEAVVVSRMTPAYPEIARRAGIECQVLVDIIIDEAGRVVAATVIHVSEPGYGFEANALRAAKQLRFAPMYQNNRPVMVKMVYPIRFKLR